MARSYFEVETAIWKELPPDKAVILGSRAPFWPPKFRWELLTRWVEASVSHDINDEHAVKIYSILYNCSEDEVKKIFQAEMH